VPVAGRMISRATSHRRPALSLPNTPGCDSSSRFQPPLKVLVKRTIPIALCVWLALSLTGCTSTSTGPSNAGAASASPSVTTPDLSGASKNAASAKLGAAGLLLGAVSEAYDTSVTAGMVASQSPAPGASAAQGSAVRWF